MAAPCSIHYARFNNTTAFTWWGSNNETGGGGGRREEADLPSPPHLRDLPTAVFYVLPVKEERELIREG